MKICWDNLEKLKYRNKKGDWIDKYYKCITVCKDCHKKIHKKEGCGYYEMRCEEEYNALLCI